MTQTKQKYDSTIKMEFEEKNVLSTITANSQVNSKDIKKFITAITCAAFLGLVSPKTYSWYLKVKQAEN